MQRAHFLTQRLAKDVDLWRADPDNLSLPAASMNGDIAECSSRLIEHFAAYNRTRSRFLRARLLGRRWSPEPS